MKKNIINQALLGIIIILIILFWTNIVQAQATDTTQLTMQEMKKQILSLQADVSAINMQASYLQNAADDYFIGLVLNIAGSALITAGVLANAKAANRGSTYVVLGGAAALIGVVCHISSWGNIRKAGKPIYRP